MKLVFRKKNDIWHLMDDASLLASYRRSGETDAIEVLFNRYGHLVLGICLKYLRDENEARDACMQIFEKLMEELRKNEVLQFKSWIYTVTRNYCLIQIRKKLTLEKQKENYLHFFSEDFVNFWSEMNHTDEMEPEIQRLYAALETLQEEQRLCLDLIYFRGKSYMEITEITGFELKKVKSCIQNGKRNLKNILKPGHGEK